LQIKNKQSRIKNDESGITAVNTVNNPNGDDNNGTMLILTPPHTTPSTPAQRIKNVSSNSPEIMQGMQGVILRSSPQTINTDNSTYNSLTSPVSNGGKSPIISDSETPISSPEFNSNYTIPLVDTNSFNFNNCNLYGTYGQTPYVDDYNNHYHNQVAYIF
jgi:hypothetical protein